VTGKTDTAFLNLCDAIKDLVLGASLPVDTPPEITNSVVGVLECGVYEEPEKNESSRFPVLSILDEIQASSGDDISGRVIRSLFQARKSVQWTQNERYKNHPHMNNYLSNSVYCEFAGPRGAVRTDKTAIGFLLMGPSLEYPEHYHPACELYFPLYGTAQWKRAKEDWQERSPGVCIYHSSNCWHSIRTVKSPLLAMSLWYGDLDTLPTPALDGLEP
jgi:hypothetical protein